MTLSISSSRAVSISTGALEPVARRRRSASKPSMPGSRTSRRMRSGASSVAMVSPSSRVRREGHLVALLLEGVLDAARDRVLVLDDQDRRHRAGMVPRGARTTLVLRCRCPVPDARDVPRPNARARVCRIRRRPDGHRHRREVSHHREHQHPSAPRPRSTGPSSARRSPRLRREGILPAVVYGHGHDIRAHPDRCPGAGDCCAGTPAATRSSTSRSASAQGRPRSSCSTSPEHPVQRDAHPRRLLRGEDDRGDDRRRAHRRSWASRRRSRRRRHAAPPARDGERARAAGRPAVGHRGGHLVARGLRGHPPRERHRRARGRDHPDRCGRAAGPGPGAARGRGAGHRRRGARARRGERRPRRHPPRRSSRSVLTSERTIARP